MTELQRLSAIDPDWDRSQSAVVAREWSYLDTVRSLCELEGNPVHLANEEFTGVWHLRETHALVDWLRGRDSSLVRSADLKEWVVGQPPGPWNELLQEAVTEYELETGDAETAVNGWPSGVGRYVVARAGCCC